MMLYLITSTVNLPSKLELLRRIKSTDPLSKVIFTNAAWHAISDANLASSLTSLTACYFLHAQQASIQPTIPDYLTVCSLQDFEQYLCCSSLVCI